MRKPRNTNPFGKPHWKPKNVTLTNNLTVAKCRAQRIGTGVVDVAFREGRLAPDAMEVSRAARARIELAKELGDYGRGRAIAEAA